MSETSSLEIVNQNIENKLNDNVSDTESSSIKEASAVVQTGNETNTIELSGIATNTPTPVDFKFKYYCKLNECKLLRRKIKRMESKSLHSDKVCTY